MKRHLPDGNTELEKLLDFANVEWLITDIDGTLVQHNDAVWYQLSHKKFKMNNSQTLKCTIATGRTYFSSKSIIEQMRIQKGMPLLLYNGALIITYIENRILFRKPVPNFVLKELCELLDLKKQFLLAYYALPIENNLLESVHGFGKKEYECDTNGIIIQWHERYDTNLDISLENDTIVETFIPQITETLEPLSILISKETISSDLSRIINYLENNPSVQFTSSGSGFVEISAKGVNKGLIYNHIEVSEGKTIAAIGDNDNDVDLLSGADISVAVANSSRSAQQVANYITRMEGTAGVFELIQVIKAASKYLG